MKLNTNIMYYQTMCREQELLLYLHFLQNLFHLCKLLVQTLKRFEIFLQNFVQCNSYFQVGTYDLNAVHNFIKTGSY